MTKTDYSKSEREIFGELLRRYVCFHYHEDMESINLWGLSMWGQISQMLHKKLITSDMSKQNKTIWYKPNATVTNEVLKPALVLYLKDHPNPENDTLRYDRDYFGYICSALWGIQDSESVKQ